MAHKHHSQEEGFILVTAVIWVAVCGILAAGLLFLSRTSINSSEQKGNSEETFLLAQSAIQKARVDIHKTFEAYFNDGENAHTVSKLDWFRNLDAEAGKIGKGDFIYTFPVNESPNTSEPTGSRAESFRDGKYSIKVDVKSVPGDILSYDVKITADAVFLGSTRSVEEVAQFGLNQTPFTFAMFGEREAVLTGTGNACGHVDGDIWFNDEVDLGSSFPILNGDLYSVAELDGDFDYWGEDKYKSHTPSWAAPYSTEDNVHNYGYDGNPEKFPDQEPKDLPRLENFDEYIATGKTLNDASLSAPQHVYDLDSGELKLTNDPIELTGVVYEGYGPDGIPDTPDDGSLILDGRTEPIVLDGSVVITGDLVILGKITGEGTFFVGGNIHIVSDLEYENMYDNPDDKTEKELEIANQGKDMIGYAAKGDIIFGDYTDEQKFKKTLGSIEDVGEILSGEMTDLDKELSNDPYIFDGDHTAVGGEKSEGSFQDTKITGEITNVDATNNTITGVNTDFLNELSPGDTITLDGRVHVVQEVKDANTIIIDAESSDALDPSFVGEITVKDMGTVERKFYESVVGDEIIGALGGEPNRVDGNLISNHLIAGQLGAHGTITGTIVARDIAIDLDGTSHIVWDNRLPNMFNQLFSLGPLQMAGASIMPPSRKVWREIPYGSVKVTEAE